MQPQKDPGQSLRQLRLERNLSLETLAGESDITTLGLSNIELKSARPQRDTLIRLLDALEAMKPLSIEDRRSVLDAFGYTDTLGLPNDLDITRAISIWKEAHMDAPYPAYLVDVALRIHDWNHAAVALLGGNKSKLAGISGFDLVFMLGSYSGLSIANQEEATKKMIALNWKYFQLYKDQDWCIQHLEKIRRTYPGFSEIYDAITEGDTAPLDISATDPVLLQTPSGDILRFKVITTDIASDPRFCVDQYIPMDADTGAILTKLLQS